MCAPVTLKTPVQMNVGVEFGTFNEAEKAVHEFCQKNYHAIHVS